jgi:hypothetical protein
VFPENQTKRKDIILGRRPLEIYFGGDIMAVEREFMIPRVYFRRWLIYKNAVTEIANGRGGERQKNATGKDRKVKKSYRRMIEKEWGGAWTVKGLQVEDEVEQEKSYQGLKSGTRRICALSIHG